MNEETLHLVVKKLIGDISPKGDSSRDDKILENMKAACSLIENLLLDVNDIAYLNNHAHQHSIKLIVECVKSLNNRLGLPE